MRATFLAQARSAIGKVRTSPGRSQPYPGDAAALPICAGQATNWLLTDHPDVYLYGALHELHLLLMDEARAALYDGKFRQAAEEVNRCSVRRTSGSAPIRIRSPISV